MATKNGFILTRMVAVLNSDRDSNALLSRPPLHMALHSKENEHGTKNIDP